VLALPNPADVSLSALGNGRSRPRHRAALMSLAKPKFELEVAADGEWLQFARKGHKLVCCDCGLVHDVEFGIVNGHVEVKFKRNNRSTAAMKRKKKAP
jgi:hypothetical protein